MRKQSHNTISWGKKYRSGCSGEHEDLSINSGEEKSEEGDGERTEGQELGRRVDMDEHEGGGAGELVQHPEQRGPGLGHLPPNGHVHLIAGERRLRRIIGVRRGRRGGAGRR